MRLLLLDYSSPDGRDDGLLGVEGLSVPPGVVGIGVVVDGFSGSIVPGNPVPGKLEPEPLIRSWISAGRSPGNGSGDVLGA